MLTVSYRGREEGGREGELRKRANCGVTKTRKKSESDILLGRPSHNYFTRAIICQAIF